MDERQFSRIRIDRRAVNPFTIPKTPELPSEIKNHLKNLRRSFESYDLEWQKWRERTQAIIEQSFSAVKLDVETLKSTTATTAASTTGVVAPDLQAVNSRIGAIETRIKEIENAAAQIPQEPTMQIQTTVIEVWLANRIDGRMGSGTLEEPWDASTATKYDAIINMCRQVSDNHEYGAVLPAEWIAVRDRLRLQYAGVSNLGFVIHLLPGTYYTKGHSKWDADGSESCLMGSRTTLVGAGPSQTTVKLVPQTADVGAAKYGEVVAIRGLFPLKTQVVENLKVDCSFSEFGPGFCTGAVQLYGDYSRVSNIEVTDVGNNTIYSLLELFVVSIGSGNGDLVDWSYTDLHNAVIERVYFNDQIVAINRQYTFAMISNDSTHWCHNAVIRDCFFRQDTRYATATGNALNINQARNCIIEGNYIYNLNYAVYQDTLSCDGLIVRNNQFINVSSGVHLNASHPENAFFRNIIVENNQIEMRGSALWWEAGVCFYVQPTVTAWLATNKIYNVIIRNNIIKFYDDLNSSTFLTKGIWIWPRANVWGSYAYNFYNFIVFGNIIDISNDKCPINVGLEIENFECWNNRTREGQIVMAYIDDVAEYKDEAKFDGVAIARSETSQFERSNFHSGPIDAYGLAIPRPVSVEPVGDLLAFPDTGNLIFIAGDGDATINRMAGLHAGTVYVLINARTSAGVVTINALGGTDGNIAGDGRLHMAQLNSLEDAAVIMGVSDTMALLIGRGHPEDIFIGATGAYGVAIPSAVSVEPVADTLTLPDGGNLVFISGDGDVSISNVSNVHTGAIYVLINARTGDGVVTINSTGGFMGTGRLTMAELKSVTDAAVVIGISPTAVALVGKSHPDDIFHGAISAYGIAIPSASYVEPDGATLPLPSTNAVYVVGAGDATITAVSGARRGAIYRIYNAKATGFLRVEVDDSNIWGTYGVDALQIDAPGDNCILAVGIDSTTIKII